MVLILGADGTVEGLSNKIRRLIGFVIGDWLFALESRFPLFEECLSTLFVVVTPEAVVYESITGFDVAVT
tara:strand:+ start:602 stop:811 length:210 start_codon:yes stop_codon:yes gene_type:complete